MAAPDPSPPDAETLRDHLDRLLAFHRRAFLDRRQGGFHERLSAGGEPLADRPRRLLVQCRQLYLLAQGALLDPAARGLEADIEHGLAFLERYRDRRHGGWFFQLSAAGDRPVDPHKDLYAHAFVLFALAFCYRVTARAELADSIAETLEVLDRHLLDREHGGYREAAAEDWSIRAGPRLQNPHMHLLEALLAVTEHTPVSGAGERARRLYELFRERFHDPSTHTLGEVFTEDWRPHPQEGQRVEPGHHFEWVWLLHWQQRLDPDPAALPIADALLESGWRHGHDREHGGILDAVDRQGAVLASTKRIWPLCEAIKAAAVTWERTGQEPWNARLGALLCHLFRHYLLPDGRWREHLDREHRPLVEELPGTTGYHVALALVEAERVLRERPVS